MRPGSTPEKIRCKHGRQQSILHVADDKILRKPGSRTASTLQQILCLDTIFLALEGKIFSKIQVQINFYTAKDRQLEKVGTRATSRLQKSKQTIYFTVNPPPPHQQTTHVLAWQEMGDERPSCRQGELSKIPEELDDTYHLTGPV